MSVAKSSSLAYTLFVFYLQYGIEVLKVDRED